MPTLAAIWAVLSKLPWKWIGIVLAILGLIFSIERYGYKRGSHSRDAEVVRITADRDTWKANSAALQDAVAQQNAAVEALKTDGDNRVKQGQDALAQIQKAHAGDAQMIADLRKAASKVYGPNEPCIAPAGVAGVKL